MWYDCVMLGWIEPILFAQKEIFLEKLHTCVEGGAHLRISAWHLLMNLKNNYSLKSDKVGQKNVRILILMLYFFLNRKTHLEIWFYTCVSKILMIWSTVLEN